MDNAIVFKLLFKPKKSLKFILYMLTFKVSAKNSIALTLDICNSKNSDEWVAAALDYSEQNLTITEKPPAKKAERLGRNTDSHIDRVFDKKGISDEMKNISQTRSYSAKGHISAGMDFAAQMMASLSRIKSKNEESTLKN